MISCCPLLAAWPEDPTHWASRPHILSMTNRHPLAPAWPPPPGEGGQCLAEIQNAQAGTTQRVHLSTDGETEARGGK